MSTGAAGPQVLAATGLRRTVGGRRERRDVLADAAFTVPSGALTALVGPNGAGKSSLMRALAGATPADGARVLLDGVDLLALKRRERARRVALVEQELRAEFALSVRQVVELGRIPHESGWAVVAPDASVVDAAMETAGVAGFADRLLGTLSGGEQQRVQMARALAQEPDLLLLDEPTNHLDVRAQQEALQLLRRVVDAGTTVVAALHDLNLAAAWCDHVVVLADGAVQAVGPVTEVLTADLVRETYGVEADVMAHPRTGRPLVVF